MRWVGHVTCAEETRKHTKFYSGNLNVRDHLVNISAHGSIILKSTLTEQAVRM